MTSSPGSIKAMKALSIPGAARKGQPYGCPLATHNNSKLTFIGTGRDSYFCLRIQLSTPIRRVRIGNGLLEPRTALGGTVLITFDPIQGSLGSVEDELGGVVSEETLTHVHDWLLWRCCCSLVDDGPVQVSMTWAIAIYGCTYQTSCLRPETRAAGCNLPFSAMVKWRRRTEGFVTVGGLRIGRRMKD